MSLDRELPFHDIAPQLLASIIRAYRELVCEVDGQKKILNAEDIPDQLINRHFCWLVFYVAEGTCRHLTEGSADEAVEPLFTKQLRSKNLLKGTLRQRLESYGSLNVNEAQFIRQGPTRISMLIKHSLGSVINESSRDDRSITIPSPYQVLLDFLTIPDHPGSRAYPLLTLRSMMFQRFEIVPSGLESTAFNTFSVRELEESYSFISTSWEPRFRSKGRDNLPVPQSNPVSNLLRHFLAMLGTMHIRLSTARSLTSAERTPALVGQIEDFSEREDIHSRDLDYEFSRPQYLNKPPELSELVNCLWGVPIPLRGADTIFRGGLTFSSRGGLVCAVHGGPGSGKTALALGLSAAFSGFGIKTIYLTAEENEDDLNNRAATLLPDDIRRLPFVPNETSEWLKIRRFSLVADGGGDGSRLNQLRAEFLKIQEAIEAQSDIDGGVPLPCSTIVVLDGLHEIATQALLHGQSSTSGPNGEFHKFIEVCRSLKALVVLTTGTDWTADTSLDYLVDVAVRLNHSTESLTGAKPHRFITLSKARHQLCSPGTHGLQIAGSKGVRFTPQMNYQLDRLSIWSSRLPDKSTFKKVMLTTCHQEDLKLLPNDESAYERKSVQFRVREGLGVKLFHGSNVFINGQGSGGKAALALKIAIAPSYSRITSAVQINRVERVLIVSFLYPREYYDSIHLRLQRLRLDECGLEVGAFKSRIEVLHLYPGYLKPDTLFSKIEWTLRAAELDGDPFTTIIVDGIHNVFIQFPEIEKQTLFWPQLFSMLRTKNLFTIITHTLLSVKEAPFDTRGREDGRYRSVDDSRSDPLRHALVQKTDFRLEVDPVTAFSGGAGISEQHAFMVETHSAIGQSLPDRSARLFWSRERLVLFEERQGAFL